MRLIFVTEARFVKDGNGKFYNDEGSLGIELWKRYLIFFDEICVVARVRADSSYAGQESKCADGEGVTFFELPHYIGPHQYLSTYLAFKSRIDEIVGLCGSFLVRTPGKVGYSAAKALRNAGIPYGVEVVGDPLDVFSKGSVRHPLRLFFKYSGWWNLRSIVKHSCCAIYVTESVLQARYPVSPGVFQTTASNVILKDEFIAGSAKLLTRKSSYNMLSVGSLSQMYKAPDIVLQSICELKKMGITCKLTWLGTGRHLEEMRTMADHLGISDIVCFAGYVSNREELFNYMRDSDFFVLASRTEGLPRAVIEAMAMGLPVVGTRVGGIPELLDDSMLIDKNRSDQLTKKVLGMIQNPDHANAQARRNLNEAEKFSESNLTLARRGFFEELIRKSNGAKKSC
jgi:glycosyltransferase involved in cell wall biosynthesis